MTFKRLKEENMARPVEKHTPYWATSYVLVLNPLFHPISPIYSWTLHIHNKYMIYKFFIKTKI